MGHIVYTPFLVHYLHCISGMVNVYLELISAVTVLVYLSRDYTSIHAVILLLWDADTTMH